MKRVIRLGAAALVMSLATAAAAAAQESKPTAAAQEAKPPAATSSATPSSQVPLRLQLVLSRYQGEKKISNVPYSLTVTTGGTPTRLRMSVQVPVPSTTFGSNSPIVSYSLKEVGTNIDCQAENGLERGVYRLAITVTDTTALPASSLSFMKMPEGQQASAGMPPVVFRNFTSTFNVLLRDGQTGQYTSATDPVNGEVLKIDATLNVLK